MLLYITKTIIYRAKETVPRDFSGCGLDRIRTWSGTASPPPFETLPMVNTVKIYNDTSEIGEILYSQGFLDDNGLLRLQEAEIYIRDRLSQDHARQTRAAISARASHYRCVEVIAELKLSGPKGLWTSQ